jgi:hypothetical protein
VGLAAIASDKTQRVGRRLLALQSGYFVTTGIWPLFHRRSFEAVTGRKSDFWLVQTVGVVVAAIGAGLALGLRRDEPSPEIKLTAGVAAAGLASIDVYYAATHTIDPIYLADAIVEALFVYGLMHASVSAGARRSSAGPSTS